jgi:hypothetical protein
MLHLKDKKKEENKACPEDLELDHEMEEILTDRRRSIKWIAHLSEMLPLDGNRDPKIRERARKGIPNSMRCLVWQRLAKCDKVCPAVYKGDKQKWFYEIL